MGSVLQRLGLESKVLDIMISQNGISHYTTTDEAQDLNIHKRAGINDVSFCGYCLLRGPGKL